MLYFDHNATAPLHPAARAAWLDAHARFPANPASAHRPGQRAEVALEGAREEVAALLGCAPAALLWTSGATEGANTVLAHLAATAPAGSRLWISAVEHSCVFEAAARWFGADRIRILPVSSEGVLEMESLHAEGLLRERPAAVLLMAANNETGVLQPWEEALGLCRAAGIPMACDATQWVGRLPSLSLGACDFVFGSGHKAGAPVGVGFLKAPPSLMPLLAGGPQEDGRRGGTQNVAGVLALSAALRACAERFGETGARTEDRRRMEALLLESLPGARVLGGGAGRLWNTVALLAPPLADCRQRWVVRLDAAGVAASSGSACSSGREEPSRVLAAMGVPAGDSDRVLRLSGGWDTPESEWREVAERLRAIYERWR